MAKGKWVQWEGLVEWSMDASTWKTLTCRAKSEKGAREELSKKAKEIKDTYFRISNVKVSE